MNKFDKLFKEKIQIYEASETTNPFNRVQPSKDAEIDPLTGKPKINNPMSAPAQAASQFPQITATNINQFLAQFLAALKDAATKDQKV